MPKLLRVLDIDVLMAFSSPKSFSACPSFPTFVQWSLELQHPMCMCLGRGESRQRWQVVLARAVLILPRIETSEFWLRVHVTSTNNVHGFFSQFRSPAKPVLQKKYLLSWRQWQSYTAAVWWERKATLWKPHSPCPLWWCGWSCCWTWRWWRGHLTRAWREKQQSRFQKIPDLIHPHLCCLAPQLVFARWGSDLECF